VVPNIGEELLTEHASYDSVINAGNWVALTHSVNERLASGNVVDSGRETVRLTKCSDTDT